MTRKPQDTSAEEPDGGNLHVRFRGGPGRGDRPGLLNKSWLIPLGCMGILTVAQAQEATPPAQAAPSVRQACQADVEKLCAGVRPGGGRIRECIAAHKDELSPACKDALQSARAHRAGAKGEGPAEQPAKPQ
jgi:hypothetical protein